MPRTRPNPSPAPAPVAPVAPAEANKPIHELRHRNIRAAIWRNPTAKGVMYDVQITRSYRDGEGWRDSHSFGYDDLMNVAKLMADAHSFISTLRQKEYAESRAPAQ